VVEVQNNQEVRYVPGPFFYPSGHGFYKVEGWGE
jgi:hypothetical protein